MALREEEGIGGINGNGKNTIKIYIPIFVRSAKNNVFFVVLQNFSN